MVLVPVGCGSDPSYELIEAGGAQVVIGPPPSGDVFPEALLEGALHIGSNGCLGVLGPDVGFVPVSFPFGTAVLDDEPLVLQVYDDEYGLGDPIAMGGGFVSMELSIEQEAYPESCAGPEVFGANPTAPR